MNDYLYYKYRNVSIQNQATNSSLKTTNQDAKMTTSWHKFFLLIWKNWLLQWRHPIQTAVEILAPVLFSALLVVIRSLVDPVNYPDDTIYEPFDPTYVPIKNNSWIQSMLRRFRIAWSPKHPLLEEIINSTAKLIHVQTYPCDNSSELEKYLTSSKAMERTIAGIEFDDMIVNNNNTLPTNLIIKLRFPAESRFEPQPRQEIAASNWRTNLLFPLYQIAGARIKNANDGGYPPGYNNEGFLRLQQYLSTSIIEFWQHFTSQKNSNSLPKIQLQRYPYINYIDDPLLPALEGFVSIIIMLSFVYTCISTVKVITTEKEKQLKEAMKIMGLPNWLHWTAWFIKTLSFVFVSIILITVLLKVRWYTNSENCVFTNTAPELIFLLLLLYMFTTITFCFLISVFFSKANTASTIAGLLWFLSYSPYLFLQERYEELHLSSKLSACLGHNSAMAYGFQLILMFEGTGEGLQWHNIWKSPTPDNSFVLGHVIIMLIVDMVLYLLVALYVEQVMPGEFGVPQPWYFIFTASYWCGIPDYIGVEDSSSIDEFINNEMYEQEPVNLNAGIQIKHLRKIFRSNSRKVAVNNLSLNMYEGQITVLLGHNGAGKTTTMSMLTGIFPPSSGTAIIDGHDIRTDMPKVRASLGLCPQHNVLFDELTVEEHLYFFSSLKGLNKSAIEEEIDKYIQLLELEPKRKSASSTLSGGMQRKLSVGIALIGGSRVVMLDEPTSGMDPAARRAMWNLLQEEKKGRTLLLTTHFMDEADLLGDRIAIMAGGVLQCCGSSFFLKKRYGAGYHLILDKKEDCNAEKITNILQKYIPNISIHSDIGSELSYLLTEDQSSKFENMLKELEDNSETLKINSYGISLTTLEEVFMKVGADRDNDSEDVTEDQVNINEQNDNMNVLQTKDVEISITETRSIKYSDFIINQFHAMFMKKSLATARSWILFIIQIIIPVVFIIITVLVVRSWKTGSDLPPLEMNLNVYEEGITVMNYLSNDSVSKEWQEQYKQIVRNEKGRTIDIGNNDMNQYILDKSRSDLTTVRQRYITGMTLKDNKNIIAWFNNEPYHGAPLALNLVHNTILKTSLGTEYEIRIVNKPLPFVLETKLKKLEQGNNMGFQIAFNIGFSMAFVSSFYVLFYIRERSTKSKHLQFVSGVKVLTFWGSAYIWDILTFLVTSLGLITVLGIFQEDGFKTANDLGRMFFILLCFGYAMLPMMYLSSFCFDIPSSGFTRMTLINIFTGVAGFLVVEILAAPGLNLEHISVILDWIFLLVPHYALSTSMRSMYKVFATHKICEIACENKLVEKCWSTICSQTKQCCSMEINYYSWTKPGMGRHVVYLLLVGSLLIVILLLIEYHVFEKFIYNNCQSQLQHPPEEELDDDVLTEKLKIQNMSSTEINTYNLVLKDVTKYYKKNFLAVNRLSIRVKRNECFGLLGVNGAGKTTTFKMMTGDEKISSGEAWVNGLSLKSDMKQVHQMIGYCPQFDALIDDLTGYETLKMFCLLRGINKTEIKRVIKNLALELNFTKHLHKQVKEYSGGNKRKLSTAVALIDNPSVIYLDEPTTGMDPATKRHLWNVVCKIRDDGHCVILTSHSMEECEALCTRIAIMVNGNFRCLGSVQHLKNKFSEGFTLTIKIKKTTDSSRKYEFSSEDTEPIKKFVSLKFVGSILREEHQGLLTYYIINKDIPWSEMFGTMENAKHILNIEDYSIGQSSLEQVFLTFAKRQRTE